MVRRKKYIVKNLNKCKLNFRFYKEFCELLKVYNDLECYFLVEVKTLVSSSIVRDIANTLLVRIDVNALLQMYPVYLMEHIHFNIFCKKQFDFEIDFNRYFQNNIIQNNEWEENFFDYCNKQYNFLKSGSPYVLDTREIKKLMNNLKIEDREYIINNIENYLKYYSYRFHKNHIFYELFGFIKEEVINVIQ